MVFVDTSAFCARHIKHDSYYAAAAEWWRKLESAQLVTTNHILEESFTLLARRVGYLYAADLADRVYRSEALDIIYTTRGDETSALQYFRKLADQRVGFTDCISFAVMRSAGITTAFTFDRHFLYAGFNVIGLA